ncbi:uncharacterized protein LOC124257000 isoform X2 [Haliotis rubra]|uniref:uncharacterized protein LOC124257000 isoform X2 n=1 Tax=Haliotis rubra TaxID=36100 RepID=UPI001EE54B34|nr:uncharacterized protein LOC124257000 isoform X2 [Haliotis rubra]
MGVHLQLCLTLLLVLVVKGSSGCCSHATVHDAHIRTAYRQQCCSGWTGVNCNTAVCNPTCANGGTCIAPNTCSCRAGYHGTICGGQSCNHERPCFPAVCQSSGSSVKCNCDSGFQGQFCKTMTQDQTPHITLTRARMSFWRRGGNSKNELYGLLVDASSGNGSTLWTNQEKFNMLNITAAAMFNGASLPPLPSFIKAADTGIVSAEVQLVQVKKDVHGGADVVNLRESYPCNGTIDSNHPQALVQCFVDKENFDRSLENGDRLTITFKVSSGGYRQLYDTDANKITATEKFQGNQVEKSVAFYFDFDMPTYQRPDQAFHLSPEFTKAPITLRWEGWTDTNSGMYRYTWEAFKLEPNGDGDLREVDRLRPMIHQQVKHTTPIAYPLPYAPDEPGMYSFILEAADKANNSVYMRRFALYDKESKVTTDPNHALNISSAHQEKWFQWITDVSKPVVVDWKNHFMNYVHEHGKFLNRILPFNVKIVDDPPIFKSVANKSDDHEGRRTTAAIPNLRGIVRFLWTSAINKTGGVIKEAPPNWNDVAGLNTSFHLSLTKDNVTSGSTLTVWIKALDILDNSKVDSTSVTYDFTPPEFPNINFHRNKQSNIPFSSRLELSAMDEESGLGHIEIKVTQQSNGVSLTNKTIPMSSIPMSGCTDRVTKCYCPNSLDVCYNRVSTVAISNCWLMVSKTSLQTAAVNLNVDVVNRAGLRTSKVLQLTNLTSLNGTEAYFGPMGVKTEEISQSSVRVTWHHSPSCYPRTFIWINYEWDTGHSDMIKVYKDATYYDLTDLDPSRAYTVKVTTDYGGIKSKPVAVSFKTLNAPAEPGIGIGAIAGIAVGALLIVVVLGVGIFLWKTGKAAAMMKRRRSRYTTRRTNQERPRGKMNNAEVIVKAYKNNAYDVDDDIYLYGSMEFGSEQLWYIPKDNLKLQQELKVGRFARILKATHKQGGKSTDVVAKLLKDDVNDDNRLMMMAKINFAATQVGEHRNVLKFIGAVVNNDALGPVMVLELCRKGQLDKWLSSHQNKISEDIMEKIQQFALGVARGMDYLTNKGIVHRKLGARNCLLTSSDEIKITGFGPCKLEEDGDDKAKSDRIPVKWTAPECLQSLKGANEKSDIWSFGVTMWEIFSMGKTPYDAVRSRDLPTKIQNGYRLERPELAEDVHYELMRCCWNSSPETRPTFAEVLGKLQATFGLTPSSDETYYYAS